MIKFKFLHWHIVHFWFSLTSHRFPSPTPKFQPSSINCRSSKILLLFMPPPNWHNASLPIHEKSVKGSHLRPVVLYHSWKKLRVWGPDRYRLESRLHDFTGYMTFEEVLKSLTRILTRKNRMTMIFMSQGYRKN